MAFNFPYRAYGGAARPDAISGLNAQFRTALTNLFNAAPPSVQRELGLTSGFRSIARQQQLWDASDKTGHTVAPPGRSLHNKGLAADLYGFGLKGYHVSPETEQWVHQHARDQGLNFPMRYEPWHIQMGGRAAPVVAMPPQPAAAAKAGPATSLESYIRQSAINRGIDPDIAVRVAMSEGGLTNPTRQSDVVNNGVRETSFGPFQLRIGGGLGDRALAAGIDPRRPEDAYKAVDFALDQVKQGGWGPWMGARKQGITGMMGVGGNAATASGGAAASGGGTTTAASTDTTPPSEGGPLSGVVPASKELTTAEDKKKSLGGLLGELQQDKSTPMTNLLPQGGGGGGQSSLAALIQQYIASQMRGGPPPPGGGSLITPQGGTGLG